MMRVFFILFFVLCACSQEETRDPHLFLNLFPVRVDGQRPAADQLEIRMDDRSFTITEQSDLGSIDFDSARFEVRGTGSSATWGFSPPITTAEEIIKSTLFFSEATTAVSHAISDRALMDPTEGLTRMATPISLRAGPATVLVVHNAKNLFLEVSVDDDTRVPNEPDWQSGDLVVLAIDGQHNSRPGRYGFDDIALAFGSTTTAQIWSRPQSGITQEFSERPGGYKVFVAIPLHNLNVANDLGGGPRLMRLGLEVRDAQRDGSTTVTRWPKTWGPEDNNYYAHGSGTLALKNRVLDAQKVATNTVDFNRPGIDDFAESGATPLSEQGGPGEDQISVYALWDSAGVMFALKSSDAMFCAHDRSEGEREGILRDDAVEVVIRTTTVTAYRGIVNLRGAQVYDQLGDEPWSGSVTGPEIYYRFDLNGTLPDDDCREGNGYTFKIQIPWADLNLSAVPTLDTVLEFTVVVFDNDRGARSIASFSPLAPSEDPNTLAELRLFAY